VVCAFIILTIILREAKREEELRSNQMLDFSAVIDHDVKHMKVGYIGSAELQCNAQY
jgi:hypothetical protein